jgi:hypothetical protein
MTGLARRSTPKLLAVVAILASFWLARLPSYSPAEKAALAAQYSFERVPLPSASDAPQRRIRAVAPGLDRIAAWISAVGAAIALLDADGDGRPNDYCLVDPRTDSVTLAPIPGTGPRFEPFTLKVQRSYDASTTAPMGCLPGDFNEDGQVDLLTYYWGRTPVLFLRLPRSNLQLNHFRQRELVPYVERWYTDTVTSADVDGDGHVDIIVGNYFPDGARVLDASATEDPRMQMQDSMSRAYNGGRNRILLWRSPGRFVEARGVLSDRVAGGWTLAAAAADLDGDVRPELFFANDFGPDRLLWNDSRPRDVRITVVEGRRGFMTPASRVLGRDSFKGMGADFGDLNGDGLLDLFVSNITEEFALQESNFAFVNTGRVERMDDAEAPFVDRSEALGLSRSGWAWDAKLGDFDADGTPEIVQAIGFIRGKLNRWPELHELAMANDELLRHPRLWPRFGPGDDLSGHEPNAFFVRGPSGRFVDLARELDLAGPFVSRGVATADVDGDGDLDFAIANQWQRSYLFVNRSPRRGAFLGLRLLQRPGGERGPTRVLRGRRPLLARPAIGAAARVFLPGRPPMTAQVDGGNGHASVRSPELYFGLGRSGNARIRVELSWRDGEGQIQSGVVLLRPGWNTVVLGEDVH